MLDLNIVYDRTESFISGMSKVVKKTKQKKRNKKKFYFPIDALLRIISNIANINVYITYTVEIKIT